MKKTKKQWVELFAKFWDEQAGYQLDYPSLDVYFEDGAIMKMFIQPWYWSRMGIQIPKVSFTYEDAEHCIEVAGYAPAANQNGKKVETYMGDWVDWLKTEKGIDITNKEIKIEFWNILTN